MPSGTVARVQTSQEVVGTVGDTDLIQTTYGAIENLPGPRPGTWYIVSRMVKDRCPERSDVIVPADMVRDGKGQIIGCRAFSL
jgi:hypothetical protein